MKITTELVSKDKSGEVHLVRCDGAEVGVISRYNRNSGWSSQVGIGMAAKQISGTTNDKTEAANKVAKAGK